MSDLLTANEHAALQLAVELTNLLHLIVGDERSRAADLRELLTHVHAIQQAVLSHAAARAYPDRYRLLGGVLPEVAHG